MCIHSAAFIFLNNYVRACLLSLTVLMKWQGEVKCEWLLIDAEGDCGSPILCPCWPCLWHLQLQATLPSFFPLHLQHWLPFRFSKLSIEKFILKQRFSFNDLNNFKK